MERECGMHNGGHINTGGGTGCIDGDGGIYPDGNGAPAASPIDTIIWTDCAVSRWEGNAFYAFPFSFLPPLLHLHRPLSFCLK